jgi:predicted small lipoprotein YifL
MARLAFAIVLITFCLALGGCGQKGPLVRPGSGSTPAAAHTAPPPSDLPTPNPDEHR